MSEERDAFMEALIYVANHLKTTAKIQIPGFIEMWNERFSDGNQNNNNKNNSFLVRCVRSGALFLFNFSWGINAGSEF